MFSCCRSRGSFDYGWRPMFRALLLTLFAGIVGATVAWAVDEPGKEIGEVFLFVVATSLAPCWVAVAARDNRPDCRDTSDAIE